MDDGGGSLGPRPLLPHVLPLPFPPGACLSFLSIAKGTCTLALPEPGYSLAPPNSDRPSELPGLHAQIVWVPPVLAVQLGYWGQRHQPDMLPEEK